MTLSDLWPHLKVTTFFEVKYRKNEITLEDKVTIAQYETIPNIWNGSCLVTLTDLQTRRARLSASAELLVFQMPLNSGTGLQIRQRNTKPTQLLSATSPT